MRTTECEVIDACQKKSEYVPDKTNDNKPDNNEIYIEPS